VSQELSFEELEIQNFLTYGDFTEELRGKGLCLVEGDNRDLEGTDSNGAGKTTMANAIVWAAYGKTLHTPTSLKGDEVVHRLAGKNCFVKLKVKSGDEVFRISRYRKDKQHQNMLLLHAVDAKGNETSMVGANNEETQEKIVNLLGMSFEAFTSAVVVKEFPFTQASDADQKDILDRILGLTGIQKVHKLAKDKLALAEARHVTITASLENQRTRTKESGEHLNDLIEKENEFYDTVEETVKDLKKELADNEKALEEYEESDSDVVERLGKVQDRLSSINDLLETEEELEGDIDAVRKKIRALEKEQAPLDAEHKRQAARGNRLINVAASCGECEQEVSEDHKIKMIEDASILLEKAKTASGKIQAKIDKKEGELKELRADKDTIRQYKEEKSRLQEKEKGLLVEKEREDHKKTVMAREISNVKKEIAKAEKSESPYDQMIGKEEEKYKEHKAKVKKLKAELVGMAGSLEDLRFWAKGFGNQGIRSYMLDHVTVVLNKTVKEFTKVLTGGQVEIRFSTQSFTKKGEARDKFEVQVNNTTGSPILKGNSDGEMGRIDACVMFALNALARQRANRKVGFMFLDEILDSLDRTGKERIIELLREQAKEARIYVVSHSDDLKQYFEESVLIRKKDGYSSVVRRTSEQ
jgi:DNA repair exonuclease SbcCD ATPase subunit